MGVAATLPELSEWTLLGRENVPCVAEVVNRSLKADCTDFMSLIDTFENDNEAFYSISWNVSLRSRVTVS